jgi:phosphotriesterase-related protein
MLKAISTGLILPVLQLWGSVVMTVSGPVQSGDLGPTLSHEHVLVDFIGAEQTGAHRWDRDAVVDAVLPHLLEARDLGFKTLVECTPAYLGRDPLLLRTLSEKSGLHLLTNTGYYGARHNHFIPLSLQTLDADALAARWIKEFENGIEGTGIRPGFIKIAVDRGEQLSSFHQTLLRAACRAQLKTGLTIACHTGPGETIWEIADILHSEGVAPDRFIWVHANLDAPENLIRAARHGFWVSIDNVRPEPGIVDAIVERLSRIREAGLLQQVLLSHDAGWYRPGQPGGGAFRDYTALSKELLPALEEAGFEAAEIELLLVSNPARAYALH